MPHSGNVSAPAPREQATPEPPQIAIAVDHIDWHSKALTAAFEKRGVRATSIHLAACGFDTRKPSGLALQGYGARLRILDREGRIRSAPVKRLLSAERQWDNRQK